ncbi:MAG: 30S ribosomal protein S24e [Candidatus Odinarchaeia archaeon]
MSQKFELISEKKNPLLQRKELEYRLIHSFNSTPTRVEVRKKIAAKLNVDIDKVYVKNLIGLAGKNETKAVIHVYDNKKIALEIEPDYIIKRNEIKEEPKEQAEGTETTSAEAKNKETTDSEKKTNE